MKDNERGSVTLIVLVTVLFIIILLSSFLIYVNVKRRAQLKETEEISKIYDGDMEEIYDELGKFDTSYGRIEVIWLDTSNNIIDKPNSPASYLKGMTPVKWNGTTEATTTSSDTSWYNYIAKTGTEDNLASHWANAKNTKNGVTSYFVWIPRYAYRITYYASETSTEITGYCDGRGIVDSLGKMQYPLDAGIETVERDGISYIVHPAFMNDTASTFSHGGWTEDLAGIWVAKYESSHSDATSSNAGSSTELKAAPNVKSWTSLKIGECYTKAYNYDRDKESHLMKNSEWGAVAYLTHSQYGRNGHEIDINNSSSYITGNGGGSTNASETTGIVNAYNTTLGQKASSTGNIYGIYDLSGGANEYVAAFNSEDTNNYESSDGSSFAGTDKTSTKYATKYINNSTTKSGIKIYEVGKTGDSTKEVWKSGSIGWFNDTSNFCYSSQPFLSRGGSYGNKAFSGEFHLVSRGAYSGPHGSFRPVLV